MCYALHTTWCTSSSDTGFTCPNQGVRGTFHANTLCQQYHRLAGGQLCTEAPQPSYSSYERTVNTLGCKLHSVSAAGQAFAVHMQPLCYLPCTQQLDNLIALFMD